MTANVYKQKVKKYTQRERKLELLERLEAAYNNAHPVVGEDKPASEQLRATERELDAFEQTSRQSAVPGCAARVPAPLRDTPLDFEAKAAAGPGRGQAQHQLSDSAAAAKVDGRGD